MTTTKICLPPPPPPPLDKYNIHLFDLKSVQQPMGLCVEDKAMHWENSRHIDPINKIKESKKSFAISILDFKLSFWFLLQIRQKHTQRYCLQSRQSTKQTIMCTGRSIRVESGARRSCWCCCACSASRRWVRMQTMLWSARLWPSFTYPDGLGTPAPSELFTMQLANACTGQIKSKIKLVTFHSKTTACRI